MLTIYQVRSSDANIRNGYYIKIGKYLHGAYEYTLGRRFREEDAIPEFVRITEIPSTEIPEWAKAIDFRLVRRPKIAIIGHKRHGKDTVAEMIRDRLGLTFGSSSEICAEAFMFDLMKDTYGYKTVKECFEDRDNHRPLWHQGIRLFCYHNKKALFELILVEHNEDIYCGNRNFEEFEPSEEAGIFDFSVWVDACERKELEPATSFNISKSSADYILDNNGPEEDLGHEVDKLIKYIRNHFLF